MSLLGQRYPSFTWNRIFKLVKLDVITYCPFISEGYSFLLLQDAFRYIIGL